MNPCVYASQAHRPVLERNVLPLLFLSHAYATGRVKQVSNDGSAYLMAAIALAKHQLQNNWRLLSRRRVCRGSYEGLAGLRGWRTC